MKSQHILDDLDEGVSRVKVDAGNTMVFGYYFGLVRMQIGGVTRWYMDIRSIGGQETLVETCDIEFIKETGRRKTCQ